MLQSFFFLFLQIEIAYPMFLLMLQIFFVSVFFCFFSHFHKISYFSLLMIPSLVVFSSSLYLSTSICVDFTLKKYNLKDHCPLPPPPPIPYPPLPSPMKNPPSPTFSFIIPSLKETKKNFCKILLWMFVLYCILFSRGHYNYRILPTLVYL